MGQVDIRVRARLGVRVRAWVSASVRARMKMSLTESVATLTLVQAAARPERKKSAAHDVVARSRQVRARRGYLGRARLACHVSSYAVRR